MFRQVYEMVLRTYVRTCYWIVLLILWVRPGFVYASAAEVVIPKVNSTTQTSAQPPKAALVKPQHENNRDQIQLISQKARSTLRQANTHLSRSVRMIVRGQQLQKQGRQLKIKGKKSEGEDKIVAGQKMIDEASKLFLDSVSQIRTTQLSLNSFTEHEAQVRVSSKVKKK